MPSDINPILSKLFPSNKSHQPIRHGNSSNERIIENLTRMLGQMSPPSPQSDRLREPSIHSQLFRSDLPRMIGHVQPGTNQQYSLNSGGERILEDDGDLRRRRGGNKRSVWKRRTSNERHKERKDDKQPQQYKQVVSSTDAPWGGKMVTVRDEKGQMHVLIEYDRKQVVRCSQSPYALLPPACLKNIVLQTPEILASFPSRHAPRDARN